MAALADDKAGVRDSLYEEADEQDVKADRQVRFGHPDELSILFIAGPPTSEAEYTDLIGMARCVENVPKVEVLPVEEVEAYEILRRKWVVMDVRAVEWLGERAGEGWVGEEGEVEVEEAGVLADSEVAEVESQPAA